MQPTNNDKYIDRPFNIRPLCFWAFLVGMTVVVVSWGYRADIPWVIAVYFVLLLVGFYGLSRLKSKDAVLTFLGKNRLFFCVSMILCLTVAFSFAFTITSQTGQRSFAGLDTLSGTVERYRVFGDGGGNIVLSNARFGDTRLNGQVIVYVNTETHDWVNFDTFDRIQLITQIRIASTSNFNLNNGISYTANIRDPSTIERIGQTYTVRSVVLRHTRDFFLTHMGERNGELIYSMVFGDRSALDGEIRQDFVLGGLAHVLAVSGLHVGLVIGLLMMILSLFKISRKKQVFIIGATLLIYCYLCGFGYPVMRASIMFMTFLIMRVFLRSYDLLSSLALSAIIILILFPTSLFTVSFQLSFGCMVGIALFYRPIRNYISQYCKINWLTDGIAIYICAHIICLPLMLLYFPYFPFIGGFITNLFLLPVIILLFQISIVALVTWITFPMLYLASFVLTVVLDATTWIVSLPLSYIPTPAGGGDVFILYMLGIILFSRFIFAPQKIKYTAGGILIATYFISVLLLT